MIEDIRKLEFLARLSGLKVTHKLGHIGILHVDDSGGAKVVAEYEGTISSWTYLNIIHSLVFWEPYVGPPNEGE